MWDAFQREALTALGHVVYQRAGAASAVEMPSAAAGRDAPGLLHALSRAAGVPIEALPGLPALEQLRNPAAKRALWPRLRALRTMSHR
jgi:hypothetical protein